MKIWCMCMDVRSIRVTPQTHTLPVHEYRRSENWGVAYTKHGATMKCGEWARAYDISWQFFSHIPFFQAIFRYREYTSLTCKISLAVHYKDHERKSMRFGIRTFLPHQFYLCNVQSYIFYQAFLDFFYSLIWGKYINKSWLLYKRRLLIRNLDFRLYRLKRLHYFHSFTKFQRNLKNPAKLMR